MSALPGTLSMSSRAACARGAEETIVTLPGGTSSSRNEPFSAMPPETYGAFTTSTYADWKRCVLRAASVSAVRNGALGPPSTSSSQPRTEMGSLETRGALGFSSEQAAATSRRATNAECRMRNAEGFPRCDNPNIFMKRLLPILALLLLAQTPATVVLKTPAGDKPVAQLVQNGVMYFAADDVVGALGGSVKPDTNGFKATLGSST